jgi:rubredoxin
VSANPWKCPRCGWRKTPRVAICFFCAHRDAILRGAGIRPATRYDVLPEDLAPPVKTVPVPLRWMLRLWHWLRRES